MTGGWDRIADAADAAPASAPTDPGRLRDKLRRSAFAYLQRHSASEAHFRALMARRLARWQAAGYVVLGDLDAGVLIDALIADFRELGLVDDAVFAASRAASARAKGASRRRLAAELRAKGVDGEVAAAAIDEAGIDEFAAALRACRRRRIGAWRSGETPDRDGLNREIAALVRQGHAYAVARRALETSREEAEDRLAEAGLAR